MRKLVVNNGICKICGKPAAPNKAYKGKQSWQSLCNSCRYKKRKQEGTLCLLKHSMDATHCELCGWNGTCDLHHKDGNRGNNHRGNFQILCPNCHRNIHYPLK